MLDYKAFAIEAARREFPVPSTETLLETAIKNAELWRAAYTQAQEQGEWPIARKAAKELEFWTNKAAEGCQWLNATQPPVHKRADWFPCTCGGEHNTPECPFGYPLK